MSSVKLTPSIANQVSRWWKEPWLWLVLIGPLVVVVAGFVTLAVAVNGSDTLVDVDYYQKGLALSKPAQMTTQQSMLPAKQARNHAATAADAALSAQASKETKK
jgi:uncharacterized protein